MIALPPLDPYSYAMGALVTMAFVMITQGIDRVMKTRDKDEETVWYAMQMAQQARMAMQIRCQVNPRLPECTGHATITFRI